MSADEIKELLLSEISPQIYVSGEEEKEKRNWKSEKLFRL